ncbi:hypothetical protein [Archangium sp. Cb G35]|uniref:hypothetical protein n=1 Tax=Archangium sp. Cb G35 TaxID=1920190 RepID=UPI000A98BF2D|nr:hypothetical protein [Archangium sp. Cb G35]
MALSKDEEKLLGFVPEDGTAIGNIRLRGFLGWKEQRYWDVRDSLIENGILLIGRGKGGSVFRKAIKKSSGAPLSGPESKLYEPLERFLGKWAADQGIVNSHIQITANQGGKTTGGLWTRPDLTLISLEKFSFIVPRELMEVRTFEVKSRNNWDIQSVFEALAHSRVATRSYLMIQSSLEEREEREEPLSRIESECERHGIGLIYFDDPEDYDSFEFYLDPPRRQPEPRDVEQFIERQISEDGKRKIKNWY